MPAAGAAASCALAGFKEEAAADQAPAGPRPLSRGWESKQLSKPSGLRGWGGRGCAEEAVESRFLAAVSFEFESRTCLRRHFEKVFLASSDSRGYHSLHPNCPRG